MPQLPHDTKVFDEYGDFSPRYYFLWRFGALSSLYRFRAELPGGAEGTTALEVLLADEPALTTVYVQRQASRKRTPAAWEDEQVTDRYLEHEGPDFLLYVSTEHKQLEWTVYHRAGDEAALARARSYVKRLREAYGKRDAPTFGVLTATPGGFGLEEINVDAPALTLATHYNDDFGAPAAQIAAALSGEGSGLILLHGRPGTGKTSYIKHLIGEYPDTEFIYVPNDVVGELLKPAFVSFMLTRRNAVLVIEDAERVIRSREQSTRASVVSTILQLSDGLFSDYLNLKIVCTFNTDVSRIDKALFRRGRLIAFYEFGALAVGKSRALLAAAGEPDAAVAAPMTLAEIYNRDAGDYDGPGRGREIGFGKLVGRGA